MRVIAGHAVVWAAAAGLAAPAMAADTWPARPVRMLVGFPPGGANDLVARAVATRLAPRLGQQVIVENRAGAGGNIATELVARAAADGYTLLLGSVSSLGMGPALLGKVPYDPVNDFAPVTQVVGVSSLLAVHPTVPARSVKEFVALAKRRPGALNFATPGTGSIAHLSAELFRKTAGIHIVHVPYKGGAPALVDTLSGQVECLMSLISTGAPHVRSGRLRGIGVTSAQRARILPQVGTIAEAGYPGFEASGWLGLLFPAKTPAAVVERLQREAVAVLALPEVLDQLQASGIDPAPSSPDAFRAYIRAELAKWTTLVREAGLRSD